VPDREAGIHDVLDDEYVLARDGHLQVVRDFRRRPSFAFAEP